MSRSNILIRFNLSYSLANKCHQNSVFVEDFYLIEHDILSGLNLKNFKKEVLEGHLFASENAILKNNIFRS